MEHRTSSQEPEEGETPQKISKKQSVKQQRALERAEKAKKHKEQEQQKLNEFIAGHPNLFGTLPLVEKKPQTELEKKIFMNIKDLSEVNVGQTVLIRARLQSSYSLGNSLCFALLRQNMYSIQALIEATEENCIPGEMVKLVSKIPPESIVEVTGVIISAQVQKASHRSIELHIQKFFVVSRAEELPIQYEDISRSVTVLEEQRQQIAKIDEKLFHLENERQLTSEASKAEIEKDIVELNKQKISMRKYVEVSSEIRLNYRVIDLRTAANHAIFKVQSGVGLFFRQALTKLGFIEIHTPKLVGSETEGGASVFKVKYFEREAFLAQSPQLAKQMAIIGDMERVFEIGPVFRAERAHTARHLTEFIGLDIEIQIYQHYHEILDVIELVFETILEGLNTQYHHELTVISQQFPYEPFQYKPIRITHAEAVKMLNESPLNEYPAGELDDFMTTQERVLGQLVKEKFGSDFFIVDQYPLVVRPFYSMPNPEDSRYANAFDVFMRGQEISSGSQRVHVYPLLLERVLAHGVDPAGIAPYLESFKFGAPPHGGCGVGLERVVEFFLNLGNIRRTSMFPRDPHRLTP